MELRHLRYFVVAAEERAISRAARRLHISQPAVSRQIRDLEDELGAPLFARSADGLRLTQAGEVAFPQARALLGRSEDLASSVKALSAPAAAALAVGFIPTALPGFLADGLRAFSREREGVRVVLREMSPREQEVALRAGKLDLALLGQPGPELAREFSIAPLKRVSMAAVLPDHHLLALRRSIDLKELSEEPFITLHENHFPGRPRLMADLGRRAGFVPRVQSKAESFSELLAMVASGAGVAVLPQDVDQLPHPRAVFVRLQRPRAYLVSSAAWSPEKETEELKNLVASLRDASKTTPRTARSSKERQAAPGVRSGSKRKKGRVAASPSL